MMTRELKAKQRDLDMSEGRSFSSFVTSFIINVNHKPIC